MANKKVIDSSTMKPNTRATPSRQPVKTAARTTTQARKPVQTKRVVKAAAPKKLVAAAKPVAGRPSRLPVKTEARKLVKTSVCPQGILCEQGEACNDCVISEKPCTPMPPKIVITCVDNTHLTCIVLEENILDGAVIVADPPVPVDGAFPTPVEILGTPEEPGCVSTTCKNGTIVSVVIVGDTPLTFDNGVYSISRIYKVIDSCGNSALFTFTVSFTVSDGTGPNITICPPLSQFTECSEGTNPTPQCSALLETGCECECIFLPDCAPSDAVIDAALGSATADGCRGVVTYRDEGPFQEGEAGCYRYKIRIFTAKDECCNESTKCRVVRYLDDETDPTIAVSPTIAQILASVPGSAKCLDTPTNTEEITYECIDLGCNPTVDILLLLGTGKASDNCGSAQLCTKTKKRVGDCCYFSQTRIFTATDPCGNKSVKIVRTIRWKVDNEAPIIQCASDKTVPCGTLNPEQYFDTPDAFDGCDGCIEAENYKPDFIVRDPTTGTVISITRYWRAIDSCKNIGYGEQTITIDCSTENCDETQDGPKGCSQGFWGIKNKNGSAKWDQSTDYVVIQLALAGYPLDSPTPQNTPFLAYFGILDAEKCGISSSTTFIQALDLKGGSCNKLAIQGVAAMLNMAAFGSSYIIASPYDNINSIAKLWLAIRNALLNCTCTRNGCDCGDLAGYLDIANVHEEGGVCLAIEETQNKLALKRGLKAAPVKRQQTVKPVAKKQAAPAKPITKNVAPKKTFIPGNAQ